MIRLWLKRAAIALGVLILSFLVIFVVLNIGDDELNAKTRDQLSQKTVVPPKVLEGYLFSLGLLSPNDPINEGKIIHQRILERDFTADLGDLRIQNPLTVANDFRGCRKTPLCEPSVLRDSADSIDSDLTKSAAALNRFDQLMQYPGAASDQPAHILAPLRPMTLLNLYQLKSLEWSRELSNHQYEVFLKEWVSINVFQKGSLAYPQNTISSTIALVILERNREFLAGAVKFYPELRPKITQQILDSATLTTSAEIIRENIMKSETEVFAQVAQTPISKLFFEATNISSGPRSEPTIDPYKLLRFLSHPNRSLNSFQRELEYAQNDPCVMSAQLECGRPAELSKFDQLRNPIGYGLLTIFSGQMAHRFQDIEKKVTVLKQPLKI